jgi:hypothetical protein
MRVDRGLLWLAALAGLLAGISLATHRRLERERTTSKTHPEPLERWEDEGGGVPVQSADGDVTNVRQVKPAPT